jgi:DNA-binding NtrC family response regulator
MAESRVIQPDDLFFYGAVHPVPADHPKEGRLSQVESQEIVGALSQFNWQMAKVADYLGINRKTLREKIRKYGISRP